MNWSKFTLKDGDRTVASPCVEVVAFSYDTPAASAKGFAHALRTFTKRYGKQLKYYRTGDMKSYRAVDARTLDVPFHWLASEKMLATKMLNFFAHSGRAKTSIETPGVDLTLWGFDDPAFYVFGVALPVDVADDPDDVVSFVQEALAEFPLENGYCGYSHLFDLALDGDEVAEWAGPLLLRHPGLGYGDPMPFTNVAHKGAAVVSWLTLLGKRITADLGGVAALKKAAPKGVSILPVSGGGLLLRAGKAPQLGDVNRHDLLPLYRAVGKMVSPGRASDEDLNELVIQGMSEEAALDWLRRFFV